MLYLDLFELISQYSISHTLSEAHSHTHANCNIKETNTAESCVYIQLQLITTQCHQDEERFQCTSADMKGFSSKWNAYRSSSDRRSVRAKRQRSYTKTANVKLKFTFRYQPVEAEFEIQCLNCFKRSSPRVWIYKASQSSNLAWGFLSTPKCCCPMHGFKPHLLLYRLNLSWKLCSS